MLTRNTKFFAAALVLSFLFWFGLNMGSKGLTDFFFLVEIAKNPSMARAQVLQTPPHEKFLFQTNAKAAFAVFVKNNGATKTLFQKDADISLPIASITKLMSALVANDQYALEQKIIITKQAVDKEEDAGNFKIGEAVSVKDLLYSMLIESSNDAAEALSSTLGDEKFIRLMNVKAYSLGLQKTFFSDSAGVDPNNPAGDVNVSSARDLSLLAQYLKENNPSLLNILTIPQYNLYAQNGALHHTMRNTDELLGDQSLPLKVLGGKTGFTPKALGCLLLIAESPARNGYIIYVLLGSENRFSDMKNLIAWTLDSYDF